MHVFLWLCSLMSKWIRATISTLHKTCTASWLSRRSEAVAWAWEANSNIHWSEGLSTVQVGGLFFTPFLTVLTRLTSSMTDIWRPGLHVLPRASQSERSPVLHALARCAGVFPLFAPRQPCVRFIPDPLAEGGTW